MPIADCKSFQNKDANDSENLFQKYSTFTPPHNRKSDLLFGQFCVLIIKLNNLNLEKMDIKLKSNLSHIQQEELSELRNDETRIIRPVD